MAEVHGLHRKLPTAHARELQQVIDELSHPLRGDANARQQVLAVVVEHCLIVLDERLAEAVNRAQRGAQVVGDGVAERLQLFVGRLNFEGVPFQIHC